MSSYFFGRGLNLFFPFGPGERGAVRSLTEGGAPPESAERIVFHNRMLEVLAILSILVACLIYLGWNGAVVPLFWALFLVVAVVSLSRPLGQGEDAGSSWNVFSHVWSVFNGKALTDATRALFRKPNFMLGVWALSVVAMGVEILGYWCIKQAFSSPMDDYILMKDLGFIEFGIVITVANMTRVLPYTFASLGIYEIVSVAMFRVFDQGYLSGATVSLLDSLLINGLSLLAFVVVLGLGRSPSVLETWREFFRQSGLETTVEAS